MDYLRPAQPISAHRRPSASSWILGAYIAVLVYASLFPLTGWRSTETGLLVFLTKPWPTYQPTFDLISNVIAYIPLGVFAAFKWQPKHGTTNALRYALLLGFCLSLSMEALQNFLPRRVPSWVDLVTNCIGAFVGAAVALPYAERLNASTNWLTLKGRWLTSDPQPAILLLLGWVGIQLLPQPTLFVVGDLPGLMGDTNLGLAEWFDQYLFVDVQTSIVIESLGIMLSLWIVTTLVHEVLSEAAPRLPLGIAIVCFALVGKSIMSIRLPSADPMYWLTVGAQSGLLLGAIVASIASATNARLRRYITIFALLGLVAIANLAPVSSYQADLLASWTDGPWRSITGAMRHLSTLWPWLTIILMIILNRRRPT